MAYAGKVIQRNRMVSAGPQRRGPRKDSLRGSSPPDISYRDGAPSVVMLAGGLAVGLAVGAGAALLFAPRSGRATRRALTRRGRDVRTRAYDAWDDLRAELQRRLRRKRRNIRRQLDEKWAGWQDDDC